MIFRNIGQLIASTNNDNGTLPLPYISNDTDMSTPTGAGTITNPWVYNSLNTADSSTAIGTHDLGSNPGVLYVVSAIIDTSSESSDVGTVTFEHTNPLTPISIGGDPNNQSIVGYINKDIEIITKYVKDAANSVGSDTATFSMGSCPVPTGNLLIDEVNTTPHWVINNTLQDTAITWGTITNPIQINTIGHDSSSEQEMYLIAQTNGTCFWDITVDSEPSNDLGYLYLNGTPISNLNGVGGASQNRTGSFAVSVNDVIRIRYSKNSTLNQNNDTLTVNSLYIN